MRALTVDARSLESAQALYDALTDYDPQLSGDDEEGYRVAVELGSFDRQVLEVLDVIERHVVERSSGAARVSLDGRSYTLHAG